MRHVMTLAAGIAALALSGAASAATLTINPITAAWGPTVGGTNLNTSGNGTSSASLFWGTPTNAQSGYNFTSAPVPLDVDVVINGASSLFDLGTFTHFNRPISAGTSITGTVLTVIYGVAVDGQNIGLYQSLFNFAHDETPNAANPCKYGGANGQGVNINGCADRVSVSLDEGQSLGFELDGISYFLNIAGFDNAVNFLTVENATNTAILSGSITAEGIAPPPPPTVPEPASWAMLIAGFGLVGASMRRRRVMTASN